MLICICSKYIYRRFPLFSFAEDQNFYKCGEEQKIPSINTLIINYHYVLINKPITASDSPSRQAKPKGCPSIAGGAWRPVWGDEDNDAVFFPEHEL